MISADSASTFLPRSDFAADAELLDWAVQAFRIGAWRYTAASSAFGWSKSAEDLLDLTDHGAPSDLAGIVALGTPTWRAPRRAALIACRDLGRAYEMEFEASTPRGKSLWLRERGEPEWDGAGRIVGMRGLIQDITELVADRRRAEQLSNRLLNTFDSIRDAFITLDHDRRFALVNCEAERMIGRSKSELVGRLLEDVIPPDTGATLHHKLEIASRSGQSLRYVEQELLPGRSFDVAVFPSPDGLAVRFEEITSQRLQQMQLGLLETAVSRQNDALLITDTTRRTENGGCRIVYRNEAFARLRGYTLDEATGQAPRPRPVGRSQQAEHARIRAAVEAAEPVRAELINYVHEGQEFWLELDITPITDHAGRLTHFVSVQRDITERKHAEAKARMLDERFRLAALATTDVIWDWDVANSRLWWSDALTNVYGHTRSDDGHTSVGAWKAMIHPEDRERIFNVNLRAIEDATHWEDEYRFLHADGKVARVMDRGFVIRDADGRAVRMVGSMTDMTDRLQLEERLRNSQRLEAVGLLTGGVAHDFNNLLTVILGNAELLTDRLRDHPELQQLADITANAAEQGADLTSRLLAFARRQPLEPKNIDLNALICGMDGLLRRTLSADIQLEFEPGSGLWPAMVDGSQLEDALLNLVFNSRDAMPGGGLLRIETANVTLDAEKVQGHDGMKPGDYIMVRVSDTGTGMEPETVEHAFDPFFTTKEPGQGSGLGLSMVYGFAKQSGGHACLHSTLGKGTEVLLFLPRSLGAAADAPKPARQTDLARGNAHILVVEDDQSVREFVSRQLTGLGYRISLAADAGQALDMLASHSDVSLLFTDIVMPGDMDGTELAQKAQSLRPDLRVLLTSGYAESAALAAMRTEADFPLLSKPYRRAELAERISEILGPPSPPH